MEELKPEPTPQTPEYVNNHLVLAILVSIFCGLGMFCGFVAVAYAVQVNNLCAIGRYDLAKANSQKAKFWGICGIVVGIIFFALYFAMLGAFVASSLSCATNC